MLCCDEKRVCVCVQSFLDASPSQLDQVVRTNMVGALLCTRAALQAMQQQPNGGHVFNMDGAGADGMATPQYAAYGATKAGGWRPVVCMLSVALRAWWLWGGWYSS